MTVENIRNNSLMLQSHLFLDFLLDSIITVQFAARRETGKDDLLWFSAKKGQSLPVVCCVLLSEGIWSKGSR